MTSKDLSEHSRHLVDKLWNYCNLLRDDGLSYGDYVEQLTYLLFLKMAHERTQPPRSEPPKIPATYGWPELVKLSGKDLEQQYNLTLEKLAEEPGLLGLIFTRAENKIQDPAKLSRLVKNLINEETWTGVDVDIKGDAYEGLLEKNAADTKSGAGQYFTPRALIKAMVDVMRPVPRMVIADPACGTGGFLLASHDYITEHHQLDRDQKLFLRDRTLRGTEIVPSAARLCAMNLFLHGIGGTDINADPPIRINDSLLQPPSETVDMVLANPPFGRKSSVTMVGADGKVAKEDHEIAREDFWATTANKQLNFLQHVRSLLKIGGTAAVVLPDNVLFEAGAGETIRRALLHECDVHTMLRLPTGIFYAQGVKANVVFFKRHAASKDPATKELWVYDFRTNQNFTLKTRQMKRHHLDDFVAAFRSGARHQRVAAENFKRYTYEELATRPGFNLDVWADLVDESLTDPSTLPPPEVIAQQIVDEARAGIEAFEAIAAELAEIAASNGDESEEDAVAALLHPDDD